MNEFTLISSWRPLRNSQRHESERKLLKRLHRVRLACKSLHIPNSVLATEGVKLARSKGVVYAAGKFIKSQVDAENRKDIRLVRGTCEAQDVPLHMEVLTSKTRPDEKAFIYFSATGEVSCFSNSSNSSLKFQGRLPEAMILVHDSSMHGTELFAKPVYLPVLSMIIYLVGSLSAPAFIRLTPDGEIQSGNLKTGSRTTSLDLVANFSAAGMMNQHHTIGICIASMKSILRLESNILGSLRLSEHDCQLDEPLRTATISLLGPFQFVVAGYGFVVLYKDLVLHWTRKRSYVLLSFSNFEVLHTLEMKPPLGYDPKKGGLASRRHSSLFKVFANVYCAHISNNTFSILLVCKKSLHCIVDQMLGFNLYSVTSLGVKSHRVKFLGSNLEGGLVRMVVKKL